MKQRGFRAHAHHAGPLTCTPAVAREKAELTAARPL